MAAHTFISLCTGAGALDAGLRLALPGSQPIVYVEREVTEAGVLATSIGTGWVPDAPVWSDLLTFDAGAWRGLVDGVVGGFPCQPHSYAGKRLGEHDERNLWPDVARIVWESGASWAFFENVPGILPYYWREIRPVLQAMGFKVAEGIFSAEEVGAPHLRERLFFLAYRDGAGRRSERSYGGTEIGHPQLADGSGARRTGAGQHGSGSPLLPARPEQRQPQLGDAGHGTGGAERGQQPAQRPEVDGRGREPVADAERRGTREAPSGRPGEPRRTPARRAGEAMADAEDGGGREHVAGPRPQGRAAAGGAGAVVGDADEPGPQGARPPTRSEGWPVAAGAVAPDGLGDAERDGRDGGTAGRGESRRWAFPPGPGDADGWRAYLAERPGHEPALSIVEEWERGIRWPLAAKAPQPEIRTGAHGLAGLGRADLLHAAGNGVVPVVAAHAFLSLSTRLGMEW